MNTKIERALQPIKLTLMLSQVTWRLAEGYCFLTHNKQSQCVKQKSCLGLTSTPNFYPDHPKICVSIHHTRAMKGKSTVEKDSWELDTQMGQLKGRADSGVREGLTLKDSENLCTDFFFLIAREHHWCKHETSVRRDMMPCACSKDSLHITAGAWLWRRECLLSYTSGKANLHWLANQLLQEGNPVDNYLPERHKKLGAKPHHVLPRWTDIGRKEHW